MRFRAALKIFRFRSVRCKFRKISSGVFQGSCPFFGYFDQNQNLRSVNPGCSRPPSCSVPWGLARESGFSTCVPRRCRNLVIFVCHQKTVGTYIFWHVRAWHVGSPLHSGLRVTRNSPPNSERGPPRRRRGFSGVPQNFRGSPKSSPPA